MPASAYPAAGTPTAARRASTSTRPKSICLSDPLPHTEDPLGPEQQHQDQDHQRDDNLEFDLDPVGAELGGDPDHEPAGHGPVGGAQPAQDHGCEHGEEEDEAHVPYDLLGQAVEHPA